MILQGTCKQNVPRRILQFCDRFNVLLQKFPEISVYILVRVLAALNTNGTKPICYTSKSLIIYFAHVPRHGDMGNRLTLARK